MRIQEHQGTYQMTNEPGDIDLRSKKLWCPKDTWGPHMVITQAMSKGPQIMGMSAECKAPLSPSDQKSSGRNSMCPDDTLSHYVIKLQVLNEDGLLEGQEAGWVYGIGVE